jgi:hypothetical protein
MPARHAALSTKWPEVALALSVLCAGSLVYLLDRPGAGFFSAVIPVRNVPGLFGSIGYSLPTFAHTFSFAVLTSAWLGGSRRVCLAACAIWFSIDCAFELGQYPPVAEHVLPLMPGWFENPPILKYAEAYFASGTFDAWDLVSIAAGATAAYLVAAFPTLRNFDHE